MKPITIMYFEQLSLKSALALFGTSFGGLWLFAEPLSFFGLGNGFFSELGISGYAILCGSAFIPVLIAGFFNRWRQMNRIDFLEFTVSSSSDGINHRVRAPANMQVREFVDLFLAYLERGQAKQRIQSLNVHYTPYMEKMNGEKTTELDGDLTLLDACIGFADVCRIRGKQRYKGPMYSTNNFASRNRE